MKRSAVLALLIVAAFTCACGDDVAPTDGGGPDARLDTGSPLPPPTPGIAQTEVGEARGTREGDAWVFRGIPFAAPPVGDLRWRAPEPPEPSAIPFDADTFGSNCVQIDNTGVVVGEEDCLSLNVWTPAVLDDGPLPVMVHFHGGDNIVGSGSEALYDGRYVVENHRVLTVTVNYRLGPFGFLAHPSLAAENAAGASGNYALMDLIAALEWLQRNIGAFGGDPGRVMIYGYSAGSSNVCALVASPLAAGLFSSAITQSGFCVPHRESLVESTALRAIEALSCDSATDIAACLRGRSAEDVAGVPGGSLFELHADADYYVSVDGLVLTEPPLDTFLRGAQNQVPLIAGTTADEYLYLLDLLSVPPLETDAEYQAHLRATVDDELATFLLMHYASADYPTPRHAYSAILGDAQHHCPARTRLRNLANSQAAPVFRYVFAASTGAGHSQDVPFVFHNFGSSSRTPDELALSDTIIGYFVRLAATGDPNGDGAVPWAPYDPARDNMLLLRDVEDLTEIDGFRSAQCDAFEARAAMAP
ncbi:MAG: carboxylesterase family protein [Deltaproteobacteria bacterium]|nr:carboxylesterase family protein [Deltaproteobacteria bacterium]